MKLNRNQIDSLISELESTKRNYKSQPKKYRAKHERKSDDRDVYLESRNFKIEKIRKNEYYNS